MASGVGIETENSTFVSPPTPLTVAGLIWSQAVSVRRVRPSPARQRTGCQQHAVGSNRRSLPSKHGGAEDGGSALDDGNGLAEHIDMGQYLRLRLVLAVKEKLTTPPAVPVMVSQEESLAGARLPVKLAVAGSTAGRLSIPDFAWPSPARGWLVLREA